MIDIAMLENPSGVAPCNRAAGYIANDARARLDNGSVFDCYAAQYNDSIANPDIVADTNVPRNGCSIIRHGLAMVVVVDLGNEKAILAGVKVVPNHHLAVPTNPQAIQIDVVTQEGLRGHNARSIDLEPQTNLGCFAPHRSRVPKPFPSPN